MLSSVHVQARGCEVNAELRAHFEAKLQSLDKVWSRIDDAQVRLRLERGQHVAEITLFAAGLVTRAEERAHDCRAAEHRVTIVKERRRRALAWLFFPLPVIGRSSRSENGELRPDSVGLTEVASSRRSLLPPATTETGTVVLRRTQDAPTSLEPAQSCSG